MMLTHQVNDYVQYEIFYSILPDKVGLNQCLHVALRLNVVDLHFICIFYMYKNNEAKFAIFWQEYKNGHKNRAFFFYSSRHFSR